MPVTQQWDGSSSGVWDLDANWSSGTKPADGDSVIFDYTSASGNALAASNRDDIELVGLRIDSTYTQTWGDNGSAMIVDATAVEIGRPSGSATAGAGSGRINMSLEDHAATILVHGTKTSSTDTGKEPVRIRGDASAHTLVVKGNSLVGLATDLPTDTAAFTDVRIVDTQSTVNIGSGVTLTTLRQELGIARLYGGLTTLQQDGGTCYMYGSGTITTAKISGTAQLNSSGTITAGHVYDGGHLDLSDSLAKTITTLTLYKGAKLTMDPSVITITNPIILSGCSIEDVTINLPSGRTVVFA